MTTSSFFHSFTKSVHLTLTKRNEKLGKLERGCGDSESAKKVWVDTVSFADLDQGSEMISYIIIIINNIIFQSFLTTLKVSTVFWGSWGSNKNCFELKVEPPHSGLFWSKMRNNYILLKNEQKYTCEHLILVIFGQNNFISKKIFFS